MLDVQMAEHDNIESRRRIRGIKHKHTYLQYTAKRPGVHFIAVSFLAEHLRSYVVRSATQCPTDTNRSVFSLLWWLKTRHYSH